MFTEELSHHHIHHQTNTSMENIQYQLYGAYLKIASETIANQELALIGQN